MVDESSCQVHNHGIMQKPIVFIMGKIRPFQLTNHEYSNCVCEKLDKTRQGRKNLIKLMSSSHAECQQLECSWDKDMIYNVLQGGKECSWQCQVRRQGGYRQGWVYWQRVSSPLVLSSEWLRYTANIYPKSCWLMHAMDRQWESLVCQVKEMQVQYWIGQIFLNNAPE